MAGRYRPTVEIWTTLKSMGSSFRFIHSSRGVKCEIVDITNNKGYAKNKEHALTEETALKQAIEVAKVSDKPMTTAELVADHRRVTEELKALKAKLGEGDESFDDDPYEGMKPKDLVKLLEEKELEIPEGKKGTKAWRIAAIDLLREPVAVGAGEEDPEDPEEDEEEED